MPDIGPAEILIVLIIAVVVLGPKKLPAAGRSLGGSLREFKNGITGGEPAVVEAPAAAVVAAPVETSQTEA